MLIHAVLHFFTNRETFFSTRELVEGASLRAMVGAKLTGFVGDTVTCLSTVWSSSILFFRTAAARAGQYRKDFASFTASARQFPERLL